MESGFDASKTFKYLLCAELYSMMSPTLAIRAPQVELVKLAVLSPTSLMMRYLSPSVGVPGSKVAGFIIFFNDRNIILFLLLEPHLAPISSFLPTGRRVIL